jgi:hypothetical protein
MGKSTKEEANYRKGTEEEHCGDCTMFREPDSCTAVEGEIKKDDLCEYFKKKTVSEDVPANAMGASSSTPSTGHIDIFDPLLKARLKKSRKDKITAMWRRALQEK